MENKNENSIVDGGIDQIEYSFPHCDNCGKKIEQEPWISDSDDRVVCQTCIVDSVLKGESDEQ